jgi:hypothetical protein
MCHLSAESTAFNTAVSYKVMIISSCEQRLAVFLRARPRCERAATSSFADRRCSLLINYQAPTHIGEARKFKLGGTIRKRFLETVSIKQQRLVNMKLYFS